MTLDKRSKVSLTTGTYLSPMSHLVKKNVASIMILASIVIKMWAFQDFSHINALGIKIDLAIK